MAGVQQVWRRLNYATRGGWSLLTRPGTDKRLGHGQLVYLDYPVAPRCRQPDAGPGLPALVRQLDDAEPALRDALATLARWTPAMAAIPVHADDPAQPHWGNAFFAGLDAVALYALLAEHRPKRYVEIGSGNSTRFARRAVRDHQLPTTITSIDPFPRAEIDTLCDRVVRQRFEDVDPGFWAELEPGDIAFMDGSHRVFQNSDATAFFLEVLPALPPGVFVHVHDIYLPWDYPPALLPRFYSEQYLLAAYLLGLADPGHLLPNFYLHHDPRFTRDLEQVFAPLDQAHRPGTIARRGVSFWFRTADAR